MKVVLIQTPWSGASHGSFKKITRKYALYPPLGLMCLAAFIERAGHAVDILDLELEYQDPATLLRNLRAAGADLVGLTASTPAFHVVQEHARHIRQLGVPIVVGGPHVTVLREKALTEEFDYGVFGEGEQTLLELIGALEAGGDLAAIPGLIWRRDGAPVVNAARPFIEDLDALPFPAREKVDPRQYVFEVPERGVTPTATTELTRGCPFRCVFCSEWLNTGRRLRKRSPQNVVQEMLEVKERFGIGHFFLLDSTLTVDRKLVTAFCEELIARDAGLTFEGQTRANLVDEELLRLMQRAGLVRLNFGLESANRTVLRLMRKEVDPESVRRAFSLCGKLGISTLCGTMMGNPGDTRATILETARFVRSIPEIRYAPMAIAIPYPGTDLYEIARRGEHGLRLLEEDYRRFSRYEGGVMEVDGMGPRELVKLQRKALILMHLSVPKIMGLIQHFGFWTLFGIVAKMVPEYFSLTFGRGRRPPRAPAEDNTTLKGLGTPRG